MNIETLKNKVKDLVKEKVGKVSNPKIDAAYDVTASEVARRVGIDELAGEWAKTLTSGTPNYTPPDDFYCFYTVHCGKYEIRPCGLTEYQRWYRGGASTGNPTLGMVWKGQLWLYKIPGSALAMKATYQKKLENLKNIPDEIVDLFAKGMKAECYLPGSPERAESKGEFERAITQKYDRWRHKAYIMEQSQTRDNRWAEINAMQ